MASRGTVAIIGGGPSGLVSAKAALEFGLRPAVFEAQPDIGGVWRPETGAAWPAMATNLSRHTCAFSDHPWEPAAPDFPTQGAVHGYLRRYAEAFGLMPSVRTGCSVERLRRGSAGWSVHWRDVATGRRGTESFDAAVVASGIFSRPFVPRLPGRDRYRGRVLHSARFRAPDQVRGRRVAVVGMAFSGAEIATELAASGAEVTGIASRPMWILPRHLPSPTTRTRLPLDLVLYRRAPERGEGPVAPFEANRARNRRLDALGGNPGRIDPRLHIDPDGGQPAHVVVSDHLAGALRSGALSLRVGRASRLEREGVVLDGGVTVAADAIVWCTGYELDLPFLSRRELDPLGFDPSDRLQPVLLHLCTFHPDLPGLAFVGIYRGPYFGVIELQARWACGVLSGCLPAPEREDMAWGLEAEARVRGTAPRPQFPHGDYVGLADRIASRFGVLPDLDEAGELGDWLRDGPVVPAQYRLRGPHSDRAAAIPAIALAARRART
ncbi:MAG TPA: FAD-dependent oxidoreductase [Candidatus Dormibacteraeota bacterium]